MEEVWCRIRCEVDKRWSIYPVSLCKLLAGRALSGTRVARNYLFLYVSALVALVREERKDRPRDGDGDGDGDRSQIQRISPCFFREEEIISLLRPAWLGSSL